MFGLGVPELLIILVIGLVIFGPGKLPDVGKAIGKSIREFKSASNESERAGEAAKAKPQVDVTPQPKELAEAERKDDGSGAR